MGLFTPDDPNYDESVRQTGFDRYKQLLSFHFGKWFKLNCLTIVGLIPLAAGTAISIAASSVALLIPCSLVGGMIFGPFLSGLVDGILRDFRDDPRPWLDNYRKSWRQNWIGSLVPGALLGLFVGIFAFMGMLFWVWAESAPSPGTVVLALAAALVMLITVTLYWPQLVLFDQSPLVRLKNGILFNIRYFWRVLGVGVLQLAYWAVYVLFSPWTLLLLPFIGLWYIVFLSQFLIYPQLDDAFRIEELIREAEEKKNADN